MLKLTPLALGILTVLSIAPMSAAMTTNNQLLRVQQPAADRHAQLIIKIGGGQPDYHRREDEYRRQREFERIRELERDAERRRRHEYYSRRRQERERRYEEYRGDRHDDYRGDYRVEYTRH
jgi:hypothetical protein